MAKIKRRGKGMVGKIPIMACQDGELEFRSEIEGGKFCSCIKIRVRAWNSLSEQPITRERELEIVLSYYQAEALAEILQNFVTSKRYNRKAQTPVTVKWDGATRWSTFPYPV